MPLLSSLNKFWRHLADREKTNSVSNIPLRFFQVFLDHGVEESQIPRLLPQLKLDDLQSTKKLLAALTPELLDQTAQLFGVRLQWLEGVDEKIYEYKSCYKHPKRLLEHLASLSVFSEDDRHNFPLRVLTTTNHLDYGDQRKQLLVPVLVEKIAELGDEDIYRYYVYRDGFDWSYAPGRIQLKAMTHIVFKAFSPVPLFVISSSEMQSILNGEVIPRKYLDGCLVTNPSLEDYSLDETSLVAKEVDEFPAVMKYIQEHGFQDFSFDKPDDLQSSVAPFESPTAATSKTLEVTVTSKKSGKRAQAEVEIWEPVRNAARALWAENDQLRIAEVSRRLKNMPTFKASAFTVSAIHKQIAGVAPAHIRGKPGRKPKESP